MRWNDDLPLHDNATGNLRSFLFFLGKEDTSEIPQAALARGFWKGLLGGVETLVSYSQSVRP